MVALVSRQYKLPQSIFTVVTRATLSSILEVSLPSNSMSSLKTTATKMAILERSEIIGFYSPRIRPKNHLRQQSLIRNTKCHRSSPQMSSHLVMALVIYRALRYLILQMQSQQQLQARNILPGSLVIIWQALMGLIGISRSSLIIQTLRRSL